MRTDTATLVQRLRLTAAADWLWVIVRLTRWILTWKRYNPDFRPAGAAPIFVSARTAARMIPDDAVVVGAGLGAHGRASTLYFALRDRFREQRHPHGLTWIHCGGAGGRGRLPGTLDDLAQPGLLATVITGHTETMPALRRLADSAAMDMHVLPQGVLTFLIEAQARGSRTLRSTVGVGTFMDTRVGTGSQLCADPGPGFAVPSGDSLEYRLPPIDVALFFAPWADSTGNVYFEGATCVTEMHDAALAARANGGTVILMVAGILDEAKTPATPAIPAHMIDAIVVARYAEQTASVRQTAQWDAFLPGATVDEDRMLARIDILDRVMRVAPDRNDADRAVARLAAKMLAQQVRPDDLVNIGVGLPEEVARIVSHSELGKQIHFSTESGVLGGTPVQGGFFGVALSPESINSSAWMFHKYAEELAVTCLGMLEFDRDGNVNVSRTGPGVLHSIGPGGFIDITAGAQVLIFVGTWSRGRDTVTEEGKVRLDTGGPRKLTAHVQEITFNGKRALRQGKTIYYVTTAGVFQLTEDGLVLTHVMPGVDPRSDIQRIEPSVQLPAAGPAVVSADVVTGRAFVLPGSTAFRVTL
ncbi:hypothetical protein ABZ942_20060 [Nocardia sp. NPDC046473]|uniref:hypothetical protein n=1 Tax=Nocardia sp. NPDC046473 TaxID=3155733 RepID=UPI0034032520